MKLIFISGPSGSGKTYLSNKIIVKIKNGFVLSTDNYYKTGIISKFISKLVKGYFDRSNSFNCKLFKKDLNFILKHGIAVNKRSYNFEKKTIKNKLEETKNIKFLIVEGIFAKEVSKSFNRKNYFFLELKINKKECMKRVLKRDILERGKDRDKAEIDFLRSWDIYYEKFKNKSIKHNTNEFIISKETNLDNLLKILIN